MCFLSRQNIYWDNSSTCLALARREREKKNPNKKKPARRNPFASDTSSLLISAPRQPGKAPWLDLGLAVGPVLGWGRMNPGHPRAARQSRLLQAGWPSGQRF